MLLLDFKAAPASRGEALRVGLARASLVAMVLWILCLLAGGPEARGAEVRASSAGAFVESIGVNTHLFYTDTAYGNYPLVRDRLVGLGVRHIRDGLPPGREDLYSRLNELGALGIKSNLIYSPHFGSVPQFISDLSRVRSSVRSIEGPNELDATGGDWVGRDRALQQDLFNRSRAFDPSLRVVAPSVISPQAHRDLGDVGWWADAGNMHSYPGAQSPHMCNYGRSLPGCISDAKLNTPGDPIWATETGYHNALANRGTHPPSSERAAGIYMPRLAFEYFRHGIERTYTYELVDEFPDSAGTDQEKQFGLLRNDFSPKPAYIALKNSIALLNDSPGAAGALRYRLGGDLTGVEQMLLVKRDGSFWLALWQRASVFNVQAKQELYPAARGVTLDLEQPIESAETYRPSSSVTPTARYKKPKRIHLSVPADVLLVRLRPP